MNLAMALSRLIKRIADLEAVTSGLSVRQNNMFREGVVKSVDFEKGLAVVEAHGLETKPVPWLEQAGAVNEWTPLSVGQRVLLASPNGDPGRAVIMRGGFTDDVRPPHRVGAEKRTMIGECSITQSGSGIVIQAGGCTFTFSGEGFSQSGGEIRHDQKNIGADHRHGGVMPGPSTTDVPK